MIAAALWLACLQDASPWSGFKQGSSVEFRQLVTADGKTLSSTGKTTVTAVADDEATLKIERVESGTSASTSEKVSLKAAPTPRPCDPAKGKVVGVDKLKLGDREYACDVVQLDDASLTKLWVCKDVKVNGGVLKSEQIPSRSETEHGTIAVLAEKVKVGEREVTCWVWAQSTSHFRMGTVASSKTWTSAEVPGGLVRSESQSEAGKDPTRKTVIEVTAFEAKK